MKIRFKQMARRYFDMLYQSMVDERYALQSKLTEMDPNALILDCGCREGDNAIKLSTHIGTRRVIGVDYILSALDQAKAKGIVCFQSDLNTNLPLVDNSVDMIIATDVIEHLINPSIFVQEMYRILKPSGYMILDTPNLASWHNIFALLIGIQPFSGPNITTMEDSDLEMVRQMHRSTHDLCEEGEYQEHSDLELTRHIIVIAYRSLINMLKKTGFTIEEEYGFGYYPFPPFIAKFLQRIDIQHTHHLVIKSRKVR